MIKENKRKICEANAYSEEAKSVNSSRQHLHFILILPGTHLFAERGSGHLICLYRYFYGSGVYVDHPVPSSLFIVESALSSEASSQALHFLKQT